MTIEDILQSHEDALEFALLYGRQPAPGEVESLRLQIALECAELRARAALRPGFLNMLKYWWFK